MERMLKRQVQTKLGKTWYSVHFKNKFFFKKNAYDENATLFVKLRVFLTSVSIYSFEVKHDGASYIDGISCFTCFIDSKRKQIGSKRFYFYETSYQTKSICLDFAHIVKFKTLKLETLLTQVSRHPTFARDEEPPLDSQLIHKKTFHFLPRLIISKTLISCYNKKYARGKNCHIRWIIE